MPSKLLENEPFPNLEARRPEPTGALDLWLGTPAAAAYFDVDALSASERERFAALRRPQRREDFQVSRALRMHAEIDQAVTSESGTESLSHSRGYATLLRAPAGVAAGIDVEVHRPRDVLAIARSTFSAQETAALEASADPQREQMFYALWTAKEACAKALGLNLIDALRRCVFVQREAQWQGSIPANSQWRVCVFEPRAGVTVAVACMGAMPAGASLRLWEWPPGKRAEWPIILAASSRPSSLSSSL